MKSLKVVGLMGMLASGCGLHRPQGLQQPACASGDGRVRMRVGVYDSRAVALAYCGSERHEAKIAQLDQALRAGRRVF